MKARRTVKLLTNKECSFIKKNFKNVDNLLSYYANYAHLDYELMSQGQEAHEVFKSIEDEETVAMIFDVVETDCDGEEKMLLDIVIRGDHYCLPVTDELKAAFQEDRQFQFEYGDSYDDEEIEAFDFVRFLSYFVKIKDNTITEMKPLQDGIRREGEAVFMKILQCGPLSIPYINKQMNM